MTLRQGKVPTVTVAALAALAALGCFLVEHFKIETHPWAREKRAAVKATREGQETIRKARLKAGLKIDDEVDPARTGLIGKEDAEGLITTDRGYLRSKQISTNPDLAAVMVALLKELKIDNGDVVAVGMSGSFPGANLATICAIETIGAVALPITSVGSSTYGANEAEFTWLDMEKALADAGTIRAKSLAASIGGDKDKGVGLNRSSVALIDAAIKRSGVEAIREKTLVASIGRRMEIYKKAAAGRPIKCYVNIGGGLASVGSSHIAARMIDTGITRTWVQRNYPTEGVLLRMLHSGVPVIHLMDFRKLATENGLEMRQGKPGDSGDGPTFTRKRYNLPLVVGTLLFLLLVTAIAVRLDVRHSLFAPTSDPPPDPGGPSL